MRIEARASRPGDREWISAELAREFHGPRIERGEEILNALDLPALVAEFEGERAGLLTYMLHADHGEVFTLSSRRERLGIGSALLAAAEAAFFEAGHRESRLFTINSNLNALGFYQRRGYRLWQVHRDTITRARALRKPEIPLLDGNGILIADELELRKPL
jgi:ribosomal protein S18 acetylase RimI-like enzyme